MFSFFKKKKAPEPEVRMPARPPARPRQAEGGNEPPPGRAAGTAGGAPEKAATPPRPVLNDLEFTPAAASGKAPGAPPVSAPPVSAMAEAPALPPVEEADEQLAMAALTISEFDRSFTRSSVMAINVDDHLDHLAADVEQVAVLFANGQTDAARALLDAFIRAYPGPEGERFWHMYFDLLQLQGDAAAHERLAGKYAATCSGRAPAWHDRSGPVPAAAIEVRGAIMELRGEIVGCNFDMLGALLQNHRQVVLDFSSVRRIDFFSVGLLANRLNGQRQPGQEVIIHAPNQLVAELMAVVGLNSLAEIFVPKA